ncbi:hypothetical protein OAV29_00155 [Candidatus Poseidoniaceae archaeon]|nr:hypothetical protein [Candidatus Poseidoniaceae archaeon]
MSVEYIQNLFNFPGSRNPDNIEQVTTHAFLNLHELKKAGYSFNGVSANYTRKKKWYKNPKLSVTGTDGRISINLTKTTTPTASKFLNAVLYCMAYLDNKIKSADVFYNDQHGQTQGIASRHGPEKSKYMQSLVSKMNDEEFMLGLDGIIENPLPEILSEIQRSILNATKQGVVSKEEVYNIMNTHNCSARDILQAFGHLQIIMEEDNRLPNQIMFPEINLIEHEGIMDSQMMQQDILNLHDKVSLLESNVETVKQKLTDSENMVNKLKNRGLISRIFNRNV